MAPSSVLITGANRGIGLGFVRHYLGLKGVKHVFAATRNPAGATELNELSADKRLHIVKMDVQNDESIVQAEKTVAKTVGNEGLTLLINNSGVNNPVLLDGPPNRKNILSTLDVNVAGPIVVSQVFLPLLRKAAAVHSSLPVGVNRAAIVNISSGAGSITMNENQGPPGLIVYRASKTALNSVTKTLSCIAIKDNVLTVAVMPGYVATSLTENKGELTVEQSIDLMTKAMETYGREHNGGFFGKDGKPFPL